jgi:hypothetical protein
MCPVVSPSDNVNLASLAFRIVTHSSQHVAGVSHTNEKHADAIASEKPLKRLTEPGDLLLFVSDES